MPNRFDQLKADIHRWLKGITLKKTHCIAAALTLLICLTAAFFIVNDGNVTGKGGTNGQNQTALPHQPAAAAGETENESAEQAGETPPQSDPIPETPQLEATAPDGSIIVAHDLPDDMNQAPAEQYTAHFARWEFACDGGDCSGFPVEMDPALLEKLEALRNALGRPVIITSGVRCERRNAEVGGVANSRHLTGQAADLYCPGVHYSDVAHAARSLGLWVLEYPEEQYCHVEV